MRLRQDIYDYIQGNGGFEAFYREHVPTMSRPNAARECSAPCPFHDHQDTEPSWSVNVDTGLFHCKGGRCRRGGHFVYFLSIMQGEFDADHHWQPRDMDDVEREFRERHDLLQEVDKTWLRSCQDYLWAHPECFSQAAPRKPWALAEREVLRDLEVGYDHHLDRIVWPVYDAKRRLINARLLYGTTHGKAKALWHLTGEDAAHLLVPYRAWTKDQELDVQFILTEGEADALTLRLHKFAGVSGLAGCGQPLPGGQWWQGRRVAVLMDADPPGEAAADQAARAMINLAAEVRRCRLPDWPERPAGADVSDYVSYLYGQGLNYAQVGTALQEIISQGVVLERGDGPLAGPAQEVAFGHLLSAERIATPVRAPAKVVGVAQHRYAVPTRVLLTCPNGTLRRCPNCPMHHQHAGRHELALDHREARTLELIRVSSDEQRRTLAREVHAVVDCPALTVTVESSLNVVPTVLMAPSTDVEAASALQVKRKEAFLVTDERTELHANRDYAFTGVNYADPRDQRMVFLGHDVTAIEAEVWEPTVENQAALLTFRPKAGDALACWNKLRDVADDLMDGVTGIKGRRLLHLLYRTVWHSLLSFRFRGQVLKRGWLEALVMGDTGCGKSTAYQALATYYKVGHLIDCQSVTVPGLLAATVQSSLTNEWVAVPGLLPQLDGGVVCFDEFHNSLVGDSKLSLLATLASQRSEGLVRIDKAAHASFPARVRAIYLTNPGRGQLLRDLGIQPIGCVPRLVEEPENIRRFDLAMALSQAEVNVQEAIGETSLVEPRYASTAARSLLKWAHTRTAEQVSWEPGAEAEVLAVARRMCDTYWDEVPLVEAGSQHERVAKVAVAVAAQLGSCGDSWDELLVTKAHVTCAWWLFECLYGGPKNQSALDYHGWSVMRRQENTLADEPAVRGVFDAIGSHRHAFATGLLRAERITERSFRQLAPIDRSYAEQWLSTFVAARALRSTRRGDGYERTPAFTRWLQAYLAA